MNSQSASLAASAIRGYERQTAALIAIVALIRYLSSASLSRQKPTRMPYSYQAQLGTSGITLAPPGAGRTVRGMGPRMSQSSTFTMVHTTILASLGSLSGSRSTIAE